MGPGQQADSQNFQVDLGGMVELLSRNLYSGPRVFVRELLQNGFDAITARRELEPEGSPARIRFITDNNGEFLSITDTGIGLTQVEAETLLSTIGGSSKRDEFGLARSEFLGQFGIGLLSCCGRVGRMAPGPCAQRCRRKCPQNCRVQVLLLC